MLYPINPIFKSCKQHRKDDRTPMALRNGAFFFVKRKTIPVSIGDKGDWIKLDSSDFNDKFKFRNN